MIVELPGWAAAGPFATVETLSLGPRPTSTPQASEDDPSEGSLANSGDEQVPLEAVPAMSQSASLGLALPSNFANFGFSAPP